MGFKDLDGEKCRQSMAVSQKLQLLLFRINEVIQHKTNIWELLKIIVNSSTLNMTYTKTHTLNMTIKYRATMVNLLLAPLNEANGLELF